MVNPATSSAQVQITASPSPNIALLANANGCHEQHGSGFLRSQVQITASPSPNIALLANHIASSFVTPMDATNSTVVASSDSALHQTPIALPHT
jgi:hypothetical protein